jgi:hypothetical protein
MEEESPTTTAPTPKITPIRIDRYRDLMVRSLDATMIQ